ncbi:hypothetical protein Tco_1372254 [Tanacetum coccineum]
MKEGKVDTGKALDVSLVVTEGSGTKSEKQDTSSRSGNDADANDANIKPVYDEEPMAKVQLTAECNVFVNDQQHAGQPELIMKGGVDQDAEQCPNIRPLLASEYENSSPTPQLQKTSVHNSTELGTNDHNNKPSRSKLVPKVSSLADTDAPSLQELDLLFSPLYEEYFTVGNKSMSKSSALFDNSKQQDTHPTTNVQHTTEHITPPTDVNAEENNTDQTIDA